MSAPQIEWKGPPVPRAKPVPTELWEKHKEELCDLYQKMKLDDLMAMMRVRHHFIPSRRQYISQMERWGVGKYNKSNTDASKPEARMTHNPPSLSHREHEQNEIKGPEQRPRDSPPLKRNAPDGQPDVPPKKRQELAKFLSEKAYEDLAIAFDKLPHWRKAVQMWSL